MKLDPKTKNLFKFLATRLGPFVGAIWAAIYFSGERDFVKLVGYTTIVIIVWRSALSIYRRLILPAKDPRSYGKWAIVTGTTSGIGREFSEHLAKLGMPLLIISRSASKLEEQAKEIKERYGVEVRVLAYDFGQLGEEKTRFHDELERQLQAMDADGGVGLLVNNVGTANEVPMSLEELPVAQIDAMLNCNIQSVVWMTRSVLPFMTRRKSGAVISISSGSGNGPGPFLSVYSSTKAFMTQFSRSLHVEHWGSGVDFLVVTPFYVVSNLYKRKTGTIVAPMPSALVAGTFCQLGKQFVWQGHGYWFHGLLGTAGGYYWEAVKRYRKMMLDNRARYDERVQQQQAKDKSS